MDLSAGAYGCLLGPAGAGKTALLLALCGLAGRANSLTLGGVALQHLPPHRRRFALLARGGHPPIGASCAAALHGAMAARGIPRRQRAARVAALLAGFALDGATRAARLPPDATLRLRLACAYATDPVLILLDDPLAGAGDPAAAIDWLRATQRRHAIPVLHATPDRAQAFALADRIVLMDSGRVLQQGSPAQLYDAPTSLFVARRLGAANVLPGTLLGVADDIAEVRLDCGPVIEADPPAADLGPGDACQVLLRPERIALSRVAAAELGPAAISAVIRDITHGGDAIRLTLALGTETDIAVIRGAAAGMLGLAPGGTVSVAWQSRHALVFPAGGAG